MTRRFTTFLRDRRGATAVLAALSAFAAIGFGALAVDTSNFFYQRRRQQSANDLAAIAAASDIPHARAAALATLARNGFGPETLQQLEIGTYVPDAAIAPARRFTPSSDGTGNAARLTISSPVPLYLGRLFLANPAQAAPSPDGQITGGQILIGTKAVAAADRTASFAIGSRLLKLDGGLVNAVLGGLLGTNVSLTAMDYQALASARVGLFAFSDALAKRLNLTAASYDSVLSAPVKLSDAIIALGQAGSPAAPLDAGAVDALNRLGAVIPGDRLVTLAALFSPGPYGGRTVGGKAPVTVSASALGVLSALAEVSNGRHQVETTLNFGLPGIAAVSLKLAIGERPVGSAMIAVGAEGAIVHTAQTRLLLGVQVAGAPPAALVNLPLYLEIAAGTARLAAISCPAGVAQQAGATLAVRPAIADSWVGDVSMAEFNNFGEPLVPGSATLLNVAGLARVSGRAHVTSTNLADTMVPFSAVDIAAVAVKTVSTQDYTASLASALIGDLRLKVNVLGLGIGLPAGLDHAVAATLEGAAKPLDQAIANLLTTLGVGLGQADTWVTGVRCGSAVLVN